MAASSACAPHRDAPKFEIDGDRYVVPSCPEGSLGFAEEVVATGFGGGENFGQDELPDIVLGGPRGGGCCTGSLDVASLGDGGYITLSFGQRAIVDGPGVDLLVFENAFFVGGDETETFSELGSVEVSDDGETWYAFPCDAEAGTGCAGRTPTYANPNDPSIDVFDPQSAGGDGFDLADIGVTQARYVRVSDLAGDDGGFDLDAVAVVHGRCD